MSASVSVLLERIIAFRRARDWEQFHNPKDMALSLVLESSEVMEHFQWKNKDEMSVYLETHKEAIGEELADVLYWVLLMGHDFHIDVFEALERKIEKNEMKYPVEKSKGVHTKYNQF
jgi:NTP pyrophosphatase (non-canonical NTP hydrolase)